MDRCRTLSVRTWALWVGLAGGCLEREGSASVRPGAGAPGGRGAADGGANRQRSWQLMCPSLTMQEMKGGDHRMVRALQPLPPAPPAPRPARSRGASH